MKIFIIGKKKMYIVTTFFLVILLCLFAWNFYSNASAKATIYLSTNKESLEIGEEIEITINISGNETSAFTSYLYFDNSKLEYVSGPETTNVVEDHIIYVWYDETGGNNPKSAELVTFTFEAKSNGMANFTVIGEFYSKIGQLLQTDNQDISIQIGKEKSKLEKIAEEEQGTETQTDNANLQSLRLELEGMSPTFDASINQYYLTIDNTVNQLEVSAITENPNATINIDGNTNLKEGLNEININIISEDATKTNTYKIEVTKTSDLESANTNLETLAIENVLFNIPFDTNETNYEAEVSNDTTSLNLLAIPENEQATTQVTGKDNLKEGNNLVEIVVTAANGYTKKVYQINVYKRNLEEEQKYQEEQEQNKQKLEEAYQIEELSTNSTNSDENTEEINDLQEEQEQKQENAIVWGILAIVFMGLLVAIVKKYVSSK